MTDDQKQAILRLESAFLDVWALGLTVWEYGHSFFVATDQDYKNGMDATGETDHLSNWIIENTEKGEVTEMRR